MDNLGIFMFGCAVFGIAIASGFLALISSDHPNGAQGESHLSAAKSIENAGSRTGRADSIETTISS